MSTYASRQLLLNSISIQFNHTKKKVSHTQLIFTYWFLRCVKIRNKCNFYLVTYTISFNSRWVSADLFQFVFYKILDYDESYYNNERIMRESDIIHRSDSKFAFLNKKNHRFLIWFIYFYSYMRFWSKIPGGVMILYFSS